MKDAKIALQFKACEYMEKTYGKDYMKRNIVAPPITNAYIQGYLDKENEDKTVKKIIVSHKRREWFKDILKPKEEENPVDNLGGNVRKWFGIEITEDKLMPDHLGAFVDGEGNIISFINFNEEKNIPKD